MRHVPQPRSRKGLAAAAAFVLAAACWAAPGARADENDAKTILKAMSDHLAAQERLAFDFDAVLDVVTDEGQKLGLASSGSVVLDRPDRIRSTRHGGFVDVEMVFDGKTLTLLGKNVNRYTEIEIPGGIDNLVSELREKHRSAMPAADLLLSDAYGALMEEVVDVKDLGSGVIEGIECDWFAFRTAEVDWQIWVTQGETPRPCRYVITTKDVEHSPQYTIQLRNWRTGADVEAEDYVFANPTGATKVAPEDVAEAVSDLPQHFERKQP